MAIKFPLSWSHRVLGYWCKAPQRSQDRQWLPWNEATRAGLEGFEKSNMVWPQPLPDDWGIKSKREPWHPKSLASGLHQSHDPSSPPAFSTLVGPVHARYIGPMISHISSLHAFSQANSTNTPLGRPSLSLLSFLAGKFLSMSQISAP